MSRTLLVAKTNSFSPLTGSPSLLLDERGQSSGGWIDQSGNGRDFTTVGGSTPPSTGRTINSLAALDFAGGVVGSVVEGPTLSSILPLAGYHALIVFSPDAITSNTGVPYLDDCIFGDSFDYFWVTLKNVSGAYSSQAGHFDVGVKNTTATPAPPSATHLIDVSFNGSTITQRLDAGSPVTQAAGNMGGSGALRVGLGQGTSVFFDGLVGQVVGFHGVLSAPNQAAWRTYLGSKWGVAV